MYFPAPKTKTISWSWNFPQYVATKEVAHNEQDEHDEEEPSTTHAATTTSTEAPSTAKPQVFEFKFDTSLKY